MNDADDLPVWPRFYVAVLSGFDRPLTFHEFVLALWPCITETVQ